MFKALVLYTNGGINDITVNTTYFSYHSDLLPCKNNELLCYVAKLDDLHDLPPTSPWYNFLSEIGITLPEKLLGNVILCQKGAHLDQKIRTAVTSYHEIHFYPSDESESDEDNKK